MADCSFKPRCGIFFRVASIFIVVMVLAIIGTAWAFINQQRRVLWSAMTDQADALASTISGMVAQHLEAADQADIVDHCLPIVSNGGSITYVVVTRSDGRSLIFVPGQWRVEKLGGIWTPGSDEDRHAEIRHSDWSGTDALHYSHPIMHEGLTVGWVHIGLSLESFRRSVDRSIGKASITVVATLVVGFLAALLVARRITDGINRLGHFADRIASGEFDARAGLQSADELQQLGDTLDKMAAKLGENRVAILNQTHELEVINASLIDEVESRKRAEMDLRRRILAEQLLASLSSEFLQAEAVDLNGVFKAAIARVSELVSADGGAVYRLDEDQDAFNLVCSWREADGAVNAPATFPLDQIHGAWERLCEAGEIVVTDRDRAAGMTQRVSEIMTYIGIRSVACLRLGVGARSVGFLVVYCERNARAWREQQMRFMKMASGIFSNALARNDAATERERLQVQLLQAQKMEAVGKLSGGIAHDFNNMLVPIIGYSDSLLQQVPPEAPWTHELREIKRAAESAANLTRQLLTFSRKQIVSKTEVDLNQLLEGMETMLRRLLGENVFLETHLEPALWTICADRGQIEQIVMNLCVNARHAMPDGGRLMLETRLVADDDPEFVPPPNLAPKGMFIRLSVADTGCGMDERTLARIFEPFFTTKGQDGTGLGLSVVHGVVEEHGGWVSVESGLGVGTTFEIFLPVLRERRSEITTGVADAKTPLKDGEGQTILLVEDEAGVLAFVSAALKKHGYQVIAADSAAAARREFESHRHVLDLVMSDVVLPDASGVDLVEEFLTARPDLRVLMSSGYSEKGSLMQFLKRDGVFFLHKPYMLAGLLEAVNNALTVEPEAVAG